jgi:RHS repeat-associated protein
MKRIWRIPRACLPRGLDHSRKRHRHLELEALEPRTLPSSTPLISLFGVPGKAPINHELDITGQAHDSGSPVVSVQAQLDRGTPVALVLDQLNRFRFETGLPLDGSADGRHTAQFQATDKAGHVSPFYRVAFTLDTIPPAVPAFDLAPVSDSPPLGDQRTLFARVTLTGITDANAAVTLRGRAMTVHADRQGRFQFTGVPLAIGPNTLSVRATDAAGNHQDFTRTITRVPRTPVTIALAEHGHLTTQQSALVALGPVNGTRTLQFHVDAQFDQGTATSPLQDLFLVYLVDPHHHNRTLLDRGQAGTALFTLSGTGADYPAGLVGFDGGNVTIDVSSLTKANTGLLVFQLVDTDAGTGTHITVSSISESVNPAGTPSLVFPMSETLAPVGPGQSLTGLAASDAVTVQAHNVRLDPRSGDYTAELQVQNAGPALGRQVVVDFPGLPSGVHLLNPSGNDATGAPYVSFQSAIPDGGLSTNARSNSVQVVFADPKGVRFNLTPQVLVGGPNQAPVLPAIAPLSVNAGSELVVPLDAADPDGDHIQYHVESAGPLPTGGLQGSTLVFTPTPAEVGTYTFTVIASDGAVETSEAVTLNVTADSVTTTRLSGVVERATGQPLANVPVALGTTQTITAADGSFVLDFGTNSLPATVLQVHGDKASGPTVYPFVTSDVSLLLRHAIYASVNNVLPQPIVLPAVDTGDAVKIDAAQSTSVTTPRIPGAALTIAAGTLQNSNGQPFQGTLGLTAVPVATPAAPLPANVHPDLAVLVQPGSGAVTFSAPAPLTLPNRGGWPSGTAMDLWTLDPASGAWINAGAGEVSKDGKLVQTISGGVTASSLYFFAPHPAPVNDPKGDPRNLQVGMPAQEATVSFASTVALHTGAVEDDYSLPTYQSIGIARGLTLHYDSLWANPQPIINFGYDQLSVDASTLLVATLAINRDSFHFQVPGFADAAQYGLSGGENFWTIPSGASNIEAALQADLSSQPTGVYGYTVTTGLDHFDGSVFTGSSVTSTGSLVQVNTGTSPLGAGWSLAGVQQLIINPDNSALLVDGDGTVLLFGPPPQAGQPYVSPTGDFSTLVQNSDGSFTRTLKDQTVYQFSVAGLLTSVTDRNGNQTVYSYDAASRLVQITDPVGLITTLAYANNQVTITDPANRVTLLQLDGSGNLVQITAPDTSTVRYAYDAEHHRTQATDQLGFTEQDVYGFHGRVIEGTRKDGTVVQLAPAETHCLFPPAQTADPFHAPQACDPPPAQAMNSDPNNVQVTTLDQLGQLVSQADSIGAVETLVRNNLNLITQYIDGQGNATSVTYDAQGNPISLADLLSSGPFAPETDASFFGQPDAVVVHDMNGDGIPDIIGLDNSGDIHQDSQFTVQLCIADANGRPTGTFAPPVVHQLSFHANRFTVGDLNGDGLADLVFISSSTAFPFTQSLAILMNKGHGAFAAPRFVTMGQDMGGVVLADFNRDGKLDVVTADAGDSTLSVRLGSGHGTFGPRTVYHLGGAFTGAPPAVGDVNGDGIPDLVVADDPVNTVTVFLGNGDGTFTKLPPITVPGHPYDVALADVNNDHRPDIVTEGSVLLGQGNGTFTVVSNSAVTGVSAVADVDGDGHPDILAPGSHGVDIFRGNGDGTFADPVLVPFSENVVEVAAADLNGDGRPDIVAGIDTLPQEFGNIGVQFNTGGSLGDAGHSGPRTFTWDPKFNILTSWTDELGRVTTNQLDAHGNQLSHSQGDMTTQYTYTAQGQIATTTDPVNNVTTNTYDPFGQLTTLTYADGSTKQFKYDAAGNQVAVIDENNHETDTQYDAMNRVILITDALGHQTHFSYDLAGNLIAQSDARNNTTQYSYDVLGRRIKMIDALQGETYYGYDQNGNQVLIVDTLGHKTQNIYDSRNRLIETIDAQNGVTRYGYDLNNNRTSVTDPAGNVTVSAYDARNRLITDGPYNYSYDAANDLVSRTDQDGRKITYQYEDMGQSSGCACKLVATETWTAADGTIDNVIHYDYYLDGKQKTITDNFSALAFTYDNRGRLKTVDNAGTTNTPNAVLAYNYDAAGNLLTLSDTIDGQADESITYTLDALNRVIESTLAGAGISPERVDLTYNEVGQFSTIDRLADLAGTDLVVHSAYGYDALNRLSGLTHTHGANTLAFYDYTYYADGNIQTIVSDDGTASYGYDPNGQLNSVAYSSASIPGESYHWDASGNPQGNALIIGPDNELLSDGKFNYVYDAEGNLIRRTDIATGAVHEFRWDERNRLIAVVDTDAAGHLVQEVDYTYDDLDRRISERVRDAAGHVVLTDYVYDRDNVLLDFVAPDGPGGPKPTLAMRYLFGPAVDQVLAQQDAAGNVLWLLPDRLGSTRDIVDNAGTVRSHIIYDAFGNVLFQSGAMQTRYLYAGREIDPATGLYYLRARYYDPATHRFISEDPIRFRAGDVNLVRYVHNKPLTITDPTGKDSGSSDNLTRRLDSLVYILLELFFPDVLTDACSDVPSGVDPDTYAQMYGGIVNGSQVCYTSVELVFLAGLAILAAARCRREKEQEEQAEESGSDTSVDATKEREGR